MHRSNAGNIRASSLLPAPPPRPPPKVMHRSKAENIRASSPEGAAWVEDLNARGHLYVTPSGTDDDWYWLYACIKAQVRLLGVEASPNGCIAVCRRH
jgi:hypothetical protein